MILLIDNYDSFVYNLARYVIEQGVEAEVVRNDATTVEQVMAASPAAIILSPGPCTPSEAGICVELVRQVAGAIPILGVCLGHQAIAAASGANIVRAPEPVHGRTSMVTHDGYGLFAGLPSPLRVTRYHSLVVEESSLPDDLTVTARTRDNLIMGLAHQRQRTFGVQFHPEAILTQMGHELLRNFLHLSHLKTPISPAGDSLGMTSLGPHEGEGNADRNWDSDSENPLHW